jgi:hypothetical protein
MILSMFQPFSFAGSNLTNWIMHTTQFRSMAPPPILWTRDFTRRKEISLELTFHCRKWPERGIVPGGKRRLK